MEENRREITPEEILIAFRKDRRERIYFAAFKYLILVLGFGLALMVGAGAAGMLYWSELIRLPAPAAEEPAAPAQELHRPFDLSPRPAVA